MKPVVAVVLLVYKNIEDLKLVFDEFQKYGKYDFKFIVVNAHFNLSCTEQVQEICAERDVTCINIPNKGYSYGNNVGIQFALNNIDFDALLVANSDIEIKQFDLPNNLGDDWFVGGVIETLKGKSQNPFLYRRRKTAEYLIFKGFELNSKALYYIGVALNKLEREAFLLFTRLSRKNIWPVYALHGAFFVASKKAVIKNQPLFNDDMFLFNEERHLAAVLEATRTKAYLSSSIQILHKEDGSINLSDVDENSEARKSGLVFFNSSFGQIIKRR